MPTYTWPATANVVVLVGAEPVFVDIDPTTFAMSVDGLRAALEAQRVDVVMPVHPFGLMAEMPSIAALAVTAGAALIEDAACALGASIDGREAGAWGDLGCFSFHPRKAVTTGEGGAISLDDDAGFRRLRMLRNHGIDPDAASVDFAEAGFNYRMTEFQAAMGIVQLAKFESLLEDRIAASERYTKLLAASEVQTPTSPPGSVHVFQSYVVLLPRDVDRSAVITLMRAADVETTIGTYHVPMTRFFRERRGSMVGEFPITDDVADRALSLPLFAGITEGQQEQVVDSLLRAIVDRPV